MAGSAPFLGWGHMRCGPGRCCQLVACRLGPARLGTTDGPRYRCPAGHLGVMSRDVVLAPARNDTVPIQEVSVQTACH